jgi:hypothetical protein
MRTAAVTEPTVQVIDALMGGFLAVVLTVLVVSLVAATIGASNRAYRAEAELKELKAERNRKKARRDALRKAEAVDWTDVLGRRK